MDDNYRANFGAGDDLQIYHDGSTNIINGVNGNTSIRTAAAGTSGENAILIVPNGAVSLYYDDSKKFETTSAGAKITGTLEVTEDFVTTMASGYDFWIDRSGSKIQAGDNIKFQCGNSGDLQIYHNGSYNYITGDATGKNLYLRANVNEEGICVENNGPTYLAYDGTYKIQTSSAGVTVDLSLIHI